MIYCFYRVKMGQTLMCRATIISASQMLIEFHKYSAGSIPKQKEHLFTFNFTLSIEFITHEWRKAL